MSFFDRIPKALLWAAIGVSLFLNAVNVNLTSQVADRQDANARAFSTKVETVCGQISGVVGSINVGRTNNRILYKNLITDALARINTPNETSDDRANIATYQEYVGGIPVNLTINCKLLK